MQSKLSSLCISTNSLPNVLVRSIIDQTNLKNVIEQHKKRISSTRKIYSNMERDKIKQINRVKEDAVPVTAYAATSRELVKSKHSAEYDLFARRNVYSAETCRGTRKSNGFRKSSEGIKVKIEKNNVTTTKNSLSKKLNEEKLTLDDYIIRNNKVVSDFKIKRSKIKEKNKSTTRTATTTTKELNSFSQEVNNKRHENVLSEKPCKEPSLSRYIRYLKHLLKEKAMQFKLDMPLLCQCNMNSKFEVWDIDWNKCANNCLFYKNPKGYLFYIRIMSIFSIFTYLFFCNF